MIGVFGASSAAFVMAFSASSGGSLSVSGAVKKPGTFVISSPQSLTSAIQEFGGFNRDADKRRIRVISADGTVRTVDLTQMGTIPAVAPGETVEVPAIDLTKSVIVQGGVARGGAYDFRPGLTVVDVMKEAGTSKQAAIDSVRVVRPGANGTYEVLKADYLAMSSGTSVPMALRAGDTVVVPYAKGYTTSDRELLTIVVIGLLIILLVS